MHIQLLPWIWMTVAWQPTSVVSSGGSIRHLHRTRFLKKKVHVMLKCCCTKQIYSLFFSLFSIRKPCMLLGIVLSPKYKCTLTSSLFVHVECIRFWVYFNLFSYIRADGSLSFVSGVINVLSGAHSTPGNAQQLTMG